MGCRPRNAVCSGMRSLRKTQQKTRLSFNAEMSTCAAAPVPRWPADPPTELGSGWRRVAMLRLPVEPHRAPSGVKGTGGLATRRRCWGW